MDSFIGFPDKATPPTDASLKQLLGSCWRLWVTLRDHILQSYPQLGEEWKFPGAKYGWNYRIRDKQRVTIYFIPKKNGFEVAFVFGPKATDAVMGSQVSQTIKDDLSAARVYAEGRGIRLTVTNKNDLKDIKTLVTIKQKV
jgi:hypothetical protein